MFFGCKLGSVRRGFMHEILASWCGLVLTHCVNRIRLKRSHSGSTRENRPRQSVCRQTATPEASLMRKQEAQPAATYTANPVKPCGQTKLDHIVTTARWRWSLREHSLLARLQSRGQRQKDSAPSAFRSATQVLPHAPRQSTRPGSK